MPQSDRVQSFWEHVPRPFLERVFRSLFDNYLLADDRCREMELDKSERTNVRPFLRRALIEKSMRDVAGQFPDRITADAILHEGRGFWYHTRVIFDSAVALTQNTVPFPDTIVRNSCFRDCYSSGNNQPYLFPELAQEELPSDSLLYGIIVHGRSVESVLFPGFAQVRFPLPKLKGYYQSKIDLFREFPEVAEEKTTTLPGRSHDDFDSEPELQPELLDNPEFYEDQNLGG